MRANDCKEDGNDRLLTARCSRTTEIVNIPAGSNALDLAVYLKFSSFVELEFVFAVVSKRWKQYGGLYRTDCAVHIAFTAIYTMADIFEHHKTMLCDIHVDPGRVSLIVTRAAMLSLTVLIGRFEMWELRSGGVTSTSVKIPCTERKVKLAIHRYFMIPANILDLILIVGYTVLVGLELITISTQMTSNSEECVLDHMTHSMLEIYLWSIFPVLLFNRVLKFTHLSKRLGIMMKIFSLMMSDVVIFVFLAFVIASGFSLSFLNGGEGAKDGEVPLCTSMLDYDYMLVRALLRARSLRIR